MVVRGSDREAGGGGGAGEILDTDANRVGGGC